MNRSTFVKTLGGVAAAGLLVLAATTYHAPAPVAPVSTVQGQQADVVPQPTPVPTLTTAPAPAVAPAPAPVAVAPAPPAPILCPAGTTANAVDSQGNESNCNANNAQNQPCVAYDNNNNCTAYYKP